MSPVVSQSPQGQSPSPESIRCESSDSIKPESESIGPESESESSGSEAESESKSNKSQSESGLKSGLSLDS